MDTKEYISLGGRIPLFDVDWTLLKGGPSNIIHRNAFDFAMKTVYNQPNASVNEIKTDGMIDTQILLEVLKLHGVSDEEAKPKIPNAIQTMIGYFQENADKGTFEPMPGVVELLEELKKRNVPMGLLTGNIAEISWEKLRRAGIKDYFSFGAFGSMAFKRVDLIEIARKEASNVLGLEIPAKSLVIVGDSPLDIDCARAGDIDVIASAAGNFKYQDLAHANLAVESLQEMEKILRFLNVR